MKSIEFNRLKSLDSFGVPIQLTFNQNYYYKTYFGALVSVFIKGVAFYFLVTQIISWMNSEYPTIIYSNENYNIQNLLSSNQSYFYNLDNQNYNIYFVVKSEFPNQTLSYQELSNYFQIEYAYVSDVDYIQIESEPCNVRTSYEFLMSPYDKEKVPQDQTNKFRMCVKNPLKMGIFPDLKRNVVKRPLLSFQIKMCQNKTNFLNCASKEEIINIMTRTSIQVSLPTTVYDFKNNTNQIKRMFQNEFYYIDANLAKIITSEITPSYLYKDIGIFVDQYTFENVNFSPTQKTHDFNTNSEILFKYDIVFSMKADKYYIRNQKLNDILSNFGGMINLLNRIGGFICLFFNKYFLNKSLIKFIFNIDNIENDVDPNKNNQRNPDV
jgi:hypothetical protein